ncbi:unnamed protein product [Bursaphelenchus xylophilus]|uniref:(pine wood nematode) hypothetical protein n=1 Tax=Bursaphelenchus xylophilus TaxID=6326 RepID=A0A1I7SA49_BURXY|nr:unnamed protein product [Bursaphelenchus xylophilus]CAG9131817.1 unnamed protein product [Bursaphelenchus xylophilus]
MSLTEHGERHVDDLIAIINEHVEFNQTESEATAAAINLLCRFTLETGDKKTVEKSWRFLETILSQFNLLKVLRCEISPTILEWMQNEDQTLKSDLVYGRKSQKRPSFYRTEHNSSMTPTFVMWDLYQVIKWHRFFFGTPPESSPNELDIVLIVLRTLGTFAQQSLESSVLEVIFKYCPTYRMPSFEMVLEDNSLKLLENWLSLVELSVNLGILACQRAENGDKDREEAFEQCVVETVRHALGHCRKFISVCEILEEIIQSRSETENLMNVLERLNFLSKKFFMKSINFYQTNFPLSTKTQSTISELFLFMVDNFIDHNDSKVLYEVAKCMMQTLSQSKQRKTHPEGLNCPARLVFCIFSKIMEHLKRDSDVFEDLLDLISKCPKGFCQCVDQASFLKVIMLPVYTVQHVKKMADLVEYHFNRAKEESKIDLRQVWLLFDQWLSKKDVLVSTAVLKMFNHLAAMMSDDDFRRVSKVILNASVIAEPNVKSNVHNRMMAVFAARMRPGQSIDDLVDFVITNDIDECISNSHLQDGFFELLHVVLLCSDEIQFSRCFDLSLIKFSPILKTALTDIWVLLSPSAENCYNALRRFLTLFKNCYCAETTTEFFAKSSKKLTLELQTLAQSCVDVLQNCQKTTIELSKAAQLLSLLSFLIFQSSEKFIAPLKSSIHKVFDLSSASISFMILHFMVRDSYIHVIRRFDTPEPTTSHEESDDEMTQSVGTTTEQMNVVCSQKMFGFIMELLKILMKRIKTYEERMEFELIQVIMAVQEVHEEMTDTYILLLFDLIDDLTKKNASQDVMDKVLKEVVARIGEDPTSNYLSKLLEHVFLSSETAKTIAKLVNDLLKNNPAQPTAALSFPQTLSPTETPERRFKKAAAHFVLDPVHNICAPDGLTLSFWMSADRMLAQTPLQVVEFGTKKISLLMEIDLKRNIAIVKISFEGKIVEKIVIKKAFPTKNTWTNCTLGVACNENQIKAMVLIGAHLRQISSLNKDYIGDQNPFFVSFGTTSPQPTTPSYSISNLLGFKGVLSADCAILFKAMGVNRASLNCCVLGQTNFGFLNSVSKGMVEGKPDLHKLFSEPKFYLDKLQRSLLFTIFADRAHSYNLSVLQRGMEVEKFNSGQTLYLTMSQEIPLTWKCLIESKSPDVFDKSLVTIGHIKVLLLYFALTVDRDYDPLTQAEALKTLTTALKRDPTAFSAFLEMDGHSVLARILMSKKFILSDEAFKVLCRFIFTKLELENPSISSSPHSLITEPKLLVTLISTVPMWKNESFAKFINLINLIHSVTGDSRFSRKLKAFNLAQLASNNFLPAALNSLLEMLKHPDHFQTVDRAEDFAQNLCNLVKNCLDFPYNCRQVSSLWDFIQLSHPAPDFYIDKSIQGRGDWLGYEETGFTVIKEQERKISELCEVLNSMMKTHSKDEIESVWASTNSLLAIRKTFLDQDTESNPRPYSPLRYLPYNGDCPCEQRNRSVSAIPDSEHWLVQFRAATIALMAEVILNCNDSLMAVLQLDLIFWPAILVQLTNQKHTKVRTLTIVLLKNFLLRVERKHRKSFVDQNGFVFLANELKKTRLNYDIADAIFSLTLGEHVTIRNGIDADHLEDFRFDKFQSASFFALLAVLEQSVEDSNLFWSVCSTIEKIIAGGMTARTTFLDHGLVPSMIAVLVKMDELHHTESLNGPIFPILDCWMKLARCLIQGVVPYKNKKAVQRCEDLVYLAFGVEWKRDLERWERKSVTVRRMLCHVLVVWIESIQTVLSDPMNSFKSLADHNLSDDSSEFEVLGVDSDLDSYYTHPISYVAAKSLKSPVELATQEELAQRLAFGLERVTNVFLYLNPSTIMCDEEENLFDLLLSVLFQHSRVQDEWLKCLGLCKEKNRILLADLIAFLLFDVQSKLQTERKELMDESFQIIKRLKLVDYLDKELSINRIGLLNLLEVNLDYQYAFKIALHELGLISRFWPIVDSEQAYSKLDRLLKFLRSIQLDSPLSNLTDPEIVALSTDEVLLIQVFNEKIGNFGQTLHFRVQAIQTKEESFLRTIGDKANDLTCELAKLQGTPRKTSSALRKEAQSSLNRASETLWHLVRELCHPSAVFHDPSSWPQGWALDTTENLKRERRRLKPAHYQFHERFLRKERRLKAQLTAKTPQPLQRLLEGTVGKSTAELEAHTPVRFSLNAVLVRTFFECSGDIVVSDKKLYFIGEMAKTTQKGQHYEPVNYSWTFEQIREIQSRWYLLKDTAVELFTTTGDAFMMVFSTTEQRNSLLHQLVQMNLAALMVDPVVQLNSATKLWRNGMITNFDYLIVLNKLAGRSFNDLMQYPVFPFILSDYTSTLLDLTSPYSFRDLARPMAIQDRKMEQVYVQSYNALNEEHNKSQHDGMYSASYLGPYHYGSHYSNTGIVAHYMVRVVPYTNVALEYQDNNFDIPDRLFNTLETTWRLSSSESTTDFKELIPEFFFFPEMFQNRENLELGIRQSGQQVDHVILPPWCPRGNSRLFCLIHRQALESLHVTLALHNWIDLIFGYKQSGEAAIKAINMFHPATYRGRDIERESHKDEVFLSAVKTMVRTYGQMPVQLFISPHLPHLETGRCMPTAGVENQLLPSVRGIRWGDFVGSPETDDKLAFAPQCIFKLEAYERIDHLTTIHHDGHLICYGMPEDTALVAKYKSDKSDALRRNFELSMTAVLSWRFPDGILRIKPVQVDDSVWVNLLDLQSLKVSQLVYSPSNDLMYIGFTNGLIKVYTLVLDTNTKTFNCTQKGELFAHKMAISSLSISETFHILLSTSEDSTLTVWDTNRLEYIRTLDPHRRPAPLKERAALSCISQINADMAIVLHSQCGSRVNLYTVNGDLIGSHQDEMIVMSMTMTNLDEGLGVNCLALGLQTGVIRLLEMWTLSTIRLISCQNLHAPVVSLQFTSDSRRLYAALANSHVLCWQVPSLAKARNSSFKMLNPFL